MAKYILGAVVGAGLVFSGTAFAFVADYTPDLYYRQFTVNGATVDKFVDPDNGNVCYLSYSRLAAVGISCLKP